jgi:DNA mismatch repair protein MutL
VADAEPDEVRETAEPYGAPTHMRTTYSSPPPQRSETQRPLDIGPPRGFTPPPADVSWDQESTPAHPPEAHRAVSVSGRTMYLGQVMDSYLVLRLSNGSLGLLDQHAAHERVLFSSYRRQARRGDSRPLAVPVGVALHASERERLQELWTELARIGFDLATDGTDVVHMKGVPAALDAARAKRLLSDILAGQIEGLDGILTKLACAAAIKAGQPLADDEALHLLEAWLSSPDREYCPHGRPALVSLGEGDLVRLFKR